MLGLWKDCVEVKVDILDGACDGTNVSEAAELGVVIDDACVVLMLLVQNMLLQNTMTNKKSLFS